jgi:hypothetical protein
MREMIIDGERMTQAAVKRYFDLCKMGVRAAKRAPIDKFASWKVDNNASLYDNVNRFLISLDRSLNNALRKAGSIQKVGELRGPVAKSIYKGPEQRFDISGRTFPLFDAFTLSIGKKWMSLHLEHILSTDHSIRLLKGFSDWFGGRPLLRYVPLVKGNYFVEYRWVMDEKISEGKQSADRDRKVWHMVNDHNRESEASHAEQLLFNDKNNPSSSGNGGMD